MIVFKQKKGLTFAGIIPSPFCIPAVNLLRFVPFKWTECPLKTIMRIMQIQSK